MDVSDPYTFLALKRGILSYVQIKPVLAILTVFLKATGTYNEGQLKADAGYTYISVAYNISCVASALLPDCGFVDSGPASASACTV
jgi:hypothetical protein